MGLRNAYLRVLRTNALAAQKGACQYCKSPLTAKTVTADHKRPRCRGGQDSRENIAAACEACNIAKGKMSEGQFFSLIKRDLPHGQRPEIISIWASRRIWKRTYLAQKRIEQFAGASQ